MSPARVQKPASGWGSAGWIIIFADIAALLLAFFVMIFSMSSLEVEKWRAIVAHAAKGDPASVQLRPVPTATVSIPTVDKPAALPLGYLAQILDEKLREDERSGRIAIHRLDGMIVVSLPTELFFEPDKAALTESARQALFRVSSALSQIGNQVDIQGHTGPPAGETQGGDWKWRLSLERAIAVAAELRRIGYQGSPTSLGLADSRFKHLDPKIPEERRLVLARRVDLVIHPTEAGS